MNPALIPLIGSVIDRLFPDPKAAGEAKLKLMEMTQTGELAQLAATTDLAKGQLEVNKVEAGNSSVFVSGWRPAVGWVCACSMFFKYIGGPILVVVGDYTGTSVRLPDIDAMELMPILLGMLGLGVYRTVEKVKGVAK